MNVKRVLFIEGCVNLTLAIAKLCAGLLGQSYAVIADAVHSLTDVANNIVAWMVIGVAEQAPDEEHPYGHRKFEQLAVFFLASLLTIVAFEIALRAFDRLGEPVQQSTLALAILIASIVINLALTLWESRWAKRLNSSLLEADASHTFSDVLTSVAVLVGWQLAYMGYFWLDTLMALCMSGIIFYLAFKLFQKAIPILVDQKQLDESAVSQAIAKIPQINQVHRVRSRSDGKNIAADIVIGLDGDTSTEKAHQVADAIEKLMAEEFAADDVMVHVEPSHQVR